MLEHKGPDNLPKALVGAVLFHSTDTDIYFCTLFTLTTCLCSPIQCVTDMSSFSKGEEKIKEEEL